MLISFIVNEKDNVTFKDKGQKSLFKRSIRLINYLLRELMTLILSETVKTVVIMVCKFKGLNNEWKSKKTGNLDWMSTNMTQKRHACIWKLNWIACLYILKRKKI